MNDNEIKDFYIGFAEGIHSAFKDEKLNELQLMNFYVVTLSHLLKGLISHPDNSEKVVNEFIELMQECLQEGIEKGWAQRAKNKEKKNEL